MLTSQARGIRTRTTALARRPRCAGDPSEELVVVGRGADVVLARRRGSTARGIAKREQLGHAIAVGAPERGDGALEDVGEGERVAGIQRRQVDLGVAASATSRLNGAASRSRQCGCRRTRLTCLRSTVRTRSRTASSSEPTQRLRARARPRSARRRRDRPSSCRDRANAVERGLLGESAERHGYQNALSRPYDARGLAA